MSNMTFQEMFDIFVPAIIKQGERSVHYTPYSAKGVCRYRGPNGLKCAVGMLISDDKYYPALEGLRLNEVLVEVGMNSVGAYSFLLSAQVCHDDCTNPGTFVEDFKSNVKRLAYGYKLTWNPEWDNL